jgi:hypothetical protein
MSSQVVDHGSSSPSRWLRERRIRITLAIAAVEGLLFLFGALHWWAAVALAIIAIALYWYAGRNSRSHMFRQATWIFAASQLLVLCVPIALAFLKAVAVVVIALLAIGALIFLFTERS